MCPWRILLTENEVTNKNPQYAQFTVCQTLDACQLSLFSSFQRLLGNWKFFQHFCEVYHLSRYKILSNYGLY